MNFHIAQKNVTFRNTLHFGFKIWDYEPLNALKIPADLQIVRTIFELSKVFYEKFFVKENFVEENQR